MRLVHREILREPEYEEDTEWISKDRQMYSAAFVGPNVEKYSTLEDKTLINFLNSKISNIEDLKYDENWREFNTSAIIPDPMEKTQQLTWPKPTYHPLRPAPRAPSYHPSEDEALNNLLQEDDTPDLTNHQPRAIQRQPAVRQARPERRVSPVYQGSQPENGHISPRRNSQRNTDATTYQPKAIQRQIAASQPRPERQLSSIISQPEDGLISLPRNNNIVDRVRDWRSQEQSAINSNECSSINIDEISNVLLEESDPESLPSSPTPNPRGFSPDSYVTDSPPHPVAKMQLPKPKKKPPQPKPLRKPPIKQSKSSVMSVMSQATDFRSALHSNIPHIQKAATAYMNAVKNNENGDSSESDFDPDKVDQHCSKHKRINFEVIEDPIVTNLSGSDNDSDDSQKTIPAPPRTSRSESTLMSEDRAAQSTSMHKEIANRNNTPDISLHYSSDSHSVTGPSDNQPKIKILAPESPLPESVASCDDFEASLNKKVIPESIMGDSDIELSENEDIPDTPEQIVTSIREETVVTEHKAKSKTSTSTKQKQTVPQSSMTFNVTNYNQQISSTNVIPRLQQIPSNMVYIPPQYSMMGQASSVNTAQITEQMHTMGQTINIQANNPAVNSSLQIQNLIHIANSVTQPVILVVPGGSAQEMHQKPPILPQLAYLPQAPPIYPPETLSSVQRESMPQVLPPTLPQTNPPLILPPDVQRESLTQPPINPPETLPPVQRESLPQVPQQPPVNLPETLPPVQRESLPQDRQQPPINPLEILSPVQKESLPQIPQQPPTNLHETLPQVEPQVSEQPLAKPPEMLPALQPHVPLQTLHQTASSSSSCHHKNHCPSCNDSDHSHKPRKRKIIKIVKARKKFRHNTKSSGKWIVTDMETSDQEMPNTSAPSAPSSSPSTSTTSASPQHRQSNVIAQEFERLASKGAYIINKKDK
ncbi:hypothetical protein B566_EDAN012806 [Ephemera danica]|nr:hypothetical protein B566_EDAN012806 [Ephemera danica]